MQSPADYDRIRDAELTRHLDEKYATEKRRLIVKDRRVMDLLVDIDRRIAASRRVDDEEYRNAQAELRNDAMLDQPWPIHGGGE